jgi:hypothetical protein
MYTFHTEFPSNTPVPEGLLEFALSRLAELNHEISDHIIAGSNLSVWFDSRQPAPISEKLGQCQSIVVEWLKASPALTKCTPNYSLRTPGRITKNTFENGRYKLESESAPLVSGEWN